MKNVSTIAGILLGLIYVIFGLNNFLHFYSPPPPTDPAAGAFGGALFSSYLFPFMGIIEIAAGLMLFFPRTRFLGSLLLLPITANVLMYHITFDFPGSPPVGLITTLLHVVLLYSQRNQLSSLVGAPVAA